MVALPGLPQTTYDIGERNEVWNNGGNRLGNRGHSTGLLPGIAHGKVRSLVEKTSQALRSSRQLRLC